MSNCVLFVAVRGIYQHRMILSPCSKQSKRCEKDYDTRRYRAHRSYQSGGRADGPGPSCHEITQQRKPSLCSRLPVANTMQLVAPLASFCHSKRLHTCFRATLKVISICLQPYTFSQTRTSTWHILDMSRQCGASQRVFCRSEHRE